MHFQLSTILAVASASLSIATPTWDAQQSWRKGSNGDQVLDLISQRPSISYCGKTPYKTPHSPPRSKVCYVKSHNDSLTDDSTYIMDALHECNNGGHVVFKKGTKYLIGTALDLTFLNHIDIGTSS